MTKATGTPGGAASPVPQQVWILRPDDLVVVGVSLQGFDWQVDAKGRQVLGSNGSKLIVPSAGPAVLFVVTAPQSTGERARLDTSSAGVIDSLADARLSGPSVVVFEVPAGVAPIEFSSAGLLGAMSQFSVVGSGSRVKNQAIVGRFHELLPPVVGRGAAKSKGALKSLLEVPYRLVFSTAAGTSAVHRADPLTRSVDDAPELPPPGINPTDPAPKAGHGRSGLWHTRLVDDSQDRQLHGGDDAFGLADGVALAGDDWQYDLHEYEPPLLPGQPEEIANATSVGAIPVRRLMLTALGAWLDVKAEWAPGEIPGDAIALWQHVMTAGRDQHVEIAEYGFLYPFGHLGLLLAVTNRELEAGEYVLHKRYYVVPRTLILEYADRDFPYSEVRIETHATPSIAPPDANTVVLAEVGGKPFPFSIRAVDHAGVEHAFSTPLVWIKWPGAANDVDTAAADFDALGPIGMGGQRVAYAPPQAKDDSSLVTFDMRFTYAPVAHPPPDRAPFRPVLEEATLRLPGIAALGAGDTAASVAMVYSQSYVTTGSTDLLLQVTDISQAPSVDWNKTGGRSGGLVQPNGSVVAFGQGVGPVLGSAATLAGPPDPGSIFGAIASAKILGVVSLKDLLAGNTLEELIPKITDQSFNAVDFLVHTAAAVVDLGGLGPGLANVAAKAQALAAAAAAPGPALDGALADFETASATAKTGVLGNLADRGLLQRATAALDAADAAVKEAKTLGTGADIAAAYNAGLPDSFGVVHVQYSPPLRTDNSVLSVPKDGLVLAAEIRHGGTGGTGADVSCTLLGAHLDVAGVFKLGIPRVIIELHDGHKPDVNADVGSPQFLGALSFIQTLYDLLPNSGFADPPAVTVDSTGIHAGYSVAVPTIGVGIFSMSNLAIAAGLLVPFIGDPAELDVSISSREKPFLLTVSALGGGGWAVVSLDGTGLVSVEVGLEFGAAIEIDLGVASGGVSVEAGIYLVLKSGADSLSGFFRIRGEVDVLGLISACIELSLTITYDNSGKVWGEAQLSISIHICFFSTSVTVSCRRVFSGGNNDPTLAETMTGAVGLSRDRRDASAAKAKGKAAKGAPPEAWVAYCTAFAKE